MKWHWKKFHTLTAAAAAAAAERNSAEFFNLSEEEESVMDKLTKFDPAGKNV